MEINVIDVGARMLREAVLPNLPRPARFHVGGRAIRIILRVWCACLEEACVPICSTRWMLETVKKVSLDNWISLEVQTFGIYANDAFKEINGELSLERNLGGKWDQSAAPLPALAFIHSFIGAKSWKHGGEMV